MINGSAILFSNMEGLKDGTVKLDTSVNIYVRK